MTDQEIIYKAIREVVNTDNPAEFAAHNSTCYTIAKYVCEELREKLNSLPAEQPSEDLEKAATALTNEIVGELNLGDYTDHSGHNAHWHSFKEGVVAGVQWYKDQMMKSAVDATCVLLPPPDLFKVLICHDVTNNLSKGQKVKIITVTVKEDEQ